MPRRVDLEADLGMFQWMRCRFRMEFLATSSLETDPLMDIWGRPVPKCWGKQLLLHSMQAVSRTGECCQDAYVLNLFLRLPRVKFNFGVSGTEYEGGCDPTDDPHGVCLSLRIAC